MERVATCPQVLPKSCIKGVVQSNLFNVQYQAVDQIHSVANSSLIHDEIIRPQIKGEYSSTEKVTTIPESPTVRARLKKFIPFWREINASKFVLDIVESGYKIPFIQTPTSYYANKNASARNNFEFVNEAVNVLLGQRCMHRRNYRKTIHYKSINSHSPIIREEETYFRFTTR